MRSDLKSILPGGFLMLVLVLCPPGSAVAATITSNAADVTVTANNTVDGSPSATTGRAGSSTSSNFGRALVIPFQLPDLGAAVNPFTSASFSFTVATYKGALPTGASVTLSGLNARTTPTVLGSDFSASGTTVQSGILGMTGTTGLKTTDVNGSVALLNYLNAQYASGAGVGQYVFLVLEPTAYTNAAAGYDIYTADNGSMQPSLTYDVAVPEPSPALQFAAGVLALGSYALARRHRQCFSTAP